MSIELPKLPYSEKALEPHISAETLRFHHGKHHAAYVNKLNDLLPGVPALAGKSLEEIIRTSEGILFNQAAQVWNHTFLWDSMHPDGGGDPKGDLRAAIERSFGSLDAFRQEFKQVATSHFGSGWVWLVKTNDGLKIEGSHDADTPIRHGRHPLITLDVWEHAYYIDYRNERPRYVDAFLEHLVNWEVAAQRLA
jgi:Fe-Mn family superoxide dismutase